MASASAKMRYQEVREKSGKMKVEKSGHSVKVRVSLRRLYTVDFPREAYLYDILKSLLVISDKDKNLRSHYH